MINSSSNEEEQATLTTTTKLLRYFKLIIPTVQQQQQQQQQNCPAAKETCLCTIEVFAIIIITIIIIIIIIMLIIIVVQRVCLVPWTWKLTLTAIDFPHGVWIKHMTYTPRVKRVGWNIYKALKNLYIPWQSFKQQEREGGGTCLKIKYSQRCDFHCEVFRLMAASRMCLSGAIEKKVAVLRVPQPQAA